MFDLNSQQIIIQVSKLQNDIYQLSFKASAGIYILLMNDGVRKFTQKFCIEK
jgi:hypothetical protein